MALLLSLFPTNKCGAAEPTVPGLSDNKVISFEVTGNQTISAARIVLLVQTKAGQPYSEDVFSEDIKRLLATGLFSDVVPRVEEVSAGVKITIQVKENPTIKEIKFAGNKRYNRKILQDESGLTVGQLYDKAKALEAKNKVADYYLKKGFLFTEVELNAVETSPAQASLNFTVREGVIARVTKISISGNKSIKRSKIEKVLTIKKRNPLVLRLGTFKEEALNNDRNQIEKIYKKAGFADVKVTSEVKRYKKTLEVIYTIEEGKRYTLGAMTFSGNLVYPEAELRKILSKKTGNPYSEETVAFDGNNLVSFYRDRGYLKCQVEPVAVYNSGANAVDLAYQITPGGIIEIEEINITGNNRTRDKVLRREIKLTPGDIFNGAKLRKSMDNLRDLNYFEDVSVQPQEGSAPDKARLAFNVKEKERTGNLLFGLGYSTVDALVGFVSVEQTNFDWRNPPSFVGGGQNLRVSAEFGGTRRGYSLSFFEPYLNNWPLSFGFDLYSRNKDWGEYDEERVGADLRFGWRISDYWRFSLTPRVEDVTISNIQAGAPAEYLLEKGNKQSNSITVALARDTRDSRLRTTTGTNQEISLKYFGDFLGGENNFWKTEYELTYYHPLPKNFIFSAHTLLAYASGLDKGTDLPFYERYFCGGAKTVRGYAERSLGPLYTVGPFAGVARGGNLMTAANIEVSKPIYENILSLVFFADAGQTFLGSRTFKLSEIKIGVGAGVRIKVPLFAIPIKLDYGYALDPLPGESPGRLHFTIDYWF
ncbi:MAG: outer membrane protein assembly factor BamA [Candidatus Omnitrophica bacterium]|nr:outer membrane protein assembly factor BamA [Candidatus Omnitrophota bacterium]